LKGIDPLYKKSVSITGISARSNNKQI